MSPLQSRVWFLWSFDGIVEADDGIADGNSFFFVTNGFVLSKMGDGKTSFRVASQIS